MHIHQVAVAFCLCCCAGAVVGQGSVKRLGTASDAAQRMFDGGMHPSTDTIWEQRSVAEVPRFPGGDTALTEYMRRSVRWPQADAGGGDGKVVVQFVVRKDGRVDQVELLRGSRAVPDAEVLRAVRAMPAWAPGMKDGRPVDVRLSLPMMLRRD